MTQLRDHLKVVLAAEKESEERGLLPSKARALESSEGLKAECPPPQLQRKTFKTLGTPTVQADALSDNRTEISPAELVAQAERRRAELEAAGEIDWICNRQPYAAGQVTRSHVGLSTLRQMFEHTLECIEHDRRPPHNMSQGPTPDASLVGKMIEVRWRYRHKETGKPIYIWAEGEVIQVCQPCPHRLTLMPFECLCV